MLFRGTAIIQREGGWFVATCLENSVASQGRSIDEAVANLKEALALYFEDETDIPVYEPSYITALEMAV